MTRKYNAFDPLHPGINRIAIEAQASRMIPIFRIFSHCTPR